MLQSSWCVSEFTVILLMVQNCSRFRLCFVFVGIRQNKASATPLRVENLQTDVRVAYAMLDILFGCFSTELGAVFCTAQNAPGSWLKRHPNQYSQRHSGHSLCRSARSSVSLLACDAWFHFFRSAESQSRSFSITANCAVRVTRIPAYIERFCDCNFVHVHTK
jgi:hypothetical protein